MQVERGLGGLHEHPGIENLEPEGGTLEEKWRLNEFGVGSGRSKLFLRTAMINHACEPNTGHHVFEGFKVPTPDTRSCLYSETPDDAQPPLGT